MRRKGHIGLQGPCSVDETERVPSAETVARDSQLGEVEAGPHEVDRRVNDGVGNVWTVRGEEGSGVESRIVEIGGRGLSIEHVRCDREEARPGEGVGQSESMVR